MEHLKKSIEKQQSVFTTYKKDSELVTKLSFKLCECMAEKGKPFSDGDFIKNCLTIFTEYACREKKHLEEQTSLSRFTVSCRTNDLSDNIKETLKERLKSCEAFSLALDEGTDISDTAQLVIFIRAVTAGFDIVEEFLDMASLYSTTTGQDICEQALKVLKTFELNTAKLCGVTTDGAPSMTGRTNGFTKKFLNALKRLDFSAVRWLSRAATLKRFWNLQKEIKFFMESKHQNFAFLSNENLLNDLAFITDITQHLYDLNIKLQGKSQLVNKMFKHICAFEKKLELSQVQISKAILTHFTCLANRFTDLGQNGIKLKLFAQPFDLVVEDCPDGFQMELIELQADMETKRKYSENNLVDFYKLYVCEKYPNLFRHAKRMTSLFGSTYCCEQFFSKMKLIKNRCRSQLTDEHLTSQLKGCYNFCQR
uniref:general transcription factor II-I repeat domain-containing protein 2-like n=1 Tax=Styela clava TaxID=7725 RepID=UPI001939A700|nr:general transcription factor II-I repeat domain-containing protein 2-like [Styela clava]